MGNLYTRFRPHLVAVATLLMIAANAFPGASGFRGETVGSISDAHPTLLTPAGYAFSIWSVIYLGLLGFAGVQLRPARREDPLPERIAPWYLASCLLNGAWIFIWLSRWFWAALLVIAGLLFTLVRIYRILDEDRVRLRGPDRWLIVWPFSLYTAWVLVATVLSATVALQAAGFAGGGIPPAAWAVLLIAVLVGLVAALAVPRRDVVFVGVAAWALTGIGVANSGSAPWVAAVASLAAGGLILLGGWLALRPAASSP